MFTLHLYNNLINIKINNIKENGIGLLDNGTFIYLDFKE